ncbi:ribosome small subunit-dependent GTPase A [Mesoplasma photuris]|uniref:ribosome small subunit-dependent GTPase A n=1 Tax=Mesoplasma photuris TaxID=217731 RepID=UPI0004E1D450|nr:ribosome small subunit-dependent GTPase A [Mesoplasma photuris]
MQGIIIKIDSSLSYLLSEGKIYQAKLKGNVKTKIKPLVGDSVTFEFLSGEESVYIVDIHKRTSELYRPKIANVNQVLIVTALYEPIFASYILNKYIAKLETKNIEAVLIFTKPDLLDQYSNKEEILEKINWYKKSLYNVIVLDNKNPDATEVEKLNKTLQNKISVFVGQTGAGKSTTLNNFLHLNEQIKTQEISKNLNRGKHTTTLVQLYAIQNNILIADTPGFSSFDLNEIEIEDLIYGLKVFKPYLNKCKFIDCIHINENQCAIKDAVDQNVIAKFFYEDYVKMIDEVKSRKVKY